MPENSIKFTAKDKQQFIVAEISKNWGDIDELNKPILSRQFELIIEENLKRGYGLSSWKFSQVVNHDHGSLNETIIAVFTCLD